MFNSNIEIWKNAAHGGGPWTRSRQGARPWTGGPCFVLSLYGTHQQAFSQNGVLGRP